MKKGETIIVALVITLLLLGIYNFVFAPRFNGGFMGIMDGGVNGGMMGGGGTTGAQGYQTAAPEHQFKSNGERIYYTGVNQNGQRIIPTGGPMWLSMHGGSCVSCHGPDGKGSKQIMGCSSDTVAPNIQYSVLTGPEMAEEHPPYNDTTIKRAITKGIDPGGDKLEPCMPRWQMSQKDLNDVVAYLKVLGNKSK